MDRLGHVAWQRLEHLGILNTVHTVSVYSTLYSVQCTQGINTCLLLTHSLTLFKSSFKHPHISVLQREHSGQNLKETVAYSAGYLAFCEQGTFFSHIR